MKYYKLLMLLTYALLGLFMFLPSNEDSGLFFFILQKLIFLLIVISFLLLIFLLTKKSISLAFFMLNIVVAIAGLFMMDMSNHGLHYPAWFIQPAVLISSYLGVLVSALLMMFKVK